MPPQQIDERAIEERVARLLAQAPPLTDETRERITALLRAGGCPVMSHDGPLSQLDRDRIEDLGLPEAGDITPVDLAVVDLDHGRPDDAPA
jgi:hypothetical protein